MITDIAILVVAADDGIMPQTIEAINHAKAAEIPVIVAINKMDKPEANPERVKQQLTEYGLVPEEWGGEPSAAPSPPRARRHRQPAGDGPPHRRDAGSSRPTPTALPRAPSSRPAGQGRGPIATLLVQNGTLHQGD